MVFRVVSRGIKKIVTSPCDETRKIIITITSIRVSFCSFHAIYLMQGFQSGPVPGTFTRLRLCIVPAEITEPPKISSGQNQKYDGR